MAIYWRRRLTRLELVLYAGLIGVLMVVFVERLLYYMELAERTAMEVTITRVNTAINLRRAMEFLREGRHPDPSGQNPFSFARVSPPPNFRGEVFDLELDAVERGGWVFDQQRSELVYLPRLHRLLVTPHSAGAIRFRWGPSPMFMLVPTSPYTWG